MSSRPTERSPIPVIGSDYLRPWTTYFHLDAGTHRVDVASQHGVPDFAQSISNFLSENGGGCPKPWLLDGVMGEGVVTRLQNAVRTRSQDTFTTSTRAFYMFESGSLQGVISWTTHEPGPDYFDKSPVAEAVAGGYAIESDFSPKIFGAGVCTAPARGHGTRMFAAFWKYLEHRMTALRERDFNVMRESRMAFYRDMRDMNIDEFMSRSRRLDHVAQRLQNGGHLTYVLGALNERGQRFYLSVGFKTTSESERHTRFKMRALKRQVRDERAAGRAPSNRLVVPDGLSAYSGLPRMRITLPEMREARAKLVALGKVEMYPTIVTL